MRKMLFALLFSALLSTAAIAQTTNRPQIVVETGAILNGSGMTAAGGVAQSGIYWDASHALLISEASYSTGGKTDDNDNTSSAGHTRGLIGDALAKKGPWLFGVGASWSKLYTPDYDKSTVHPRADVGRDFHSGYVDRVLMSYVQSGTDHYNGMQGFEARAYWFIGAHAFAKMMAGGYFGHSTVIPISQGGSAQSVASELASKVSTSQATLTFGWRF